MNEIEELISLSDDEKIQKLKTVWANFSESTKVKIILTILEEAKRIEALELLSADFDRVKIIVTIEDDDKKIELLKKMHKDCYKIQVIKTIEDDDKKIKALEEVKDEYYVAKVIETIKDDDKKIKELARISEDDYKAIIIATIKNYDKKIELLETLYDEFAKVQVIKKIEDDDKKIELLGKLNDEDAKVEVIKTIKCDNKKIDLLETLSDDFAKVEVIKTIKDDDKKIELLKMLSDDFAKSIVISTLEDTNKMIDLLEKLDNDFAKIKIIKRIQNVDKRIELLKMLSDDFAKIIVISTIEDRNKRTKAIKKIDNEIARKIITGALQGKSLQDILLKHRDKLKDTFLKDSRKYTKIGLDPNITIGIEIESEGSMSLLLKRLSKNEERQENEDVLEWEVKEDGSLVEGVEIVSPILTDRKDDIENMYIVCSLLQRCGQQVSERCGGHIHIGADYLKSKEAYINLFEIWGNTEKIICQMSNEKGTIPRIGLREYALPISPKLSEAIEIGTINLESEESLNYFISKVQTVQNKRFFGLNLLNVNNGKNTIEFRVANGTINPDTWIENAKLYGRIVQVSQKLAEIEKQSDQSEEDKRLLYLKELLKEEIPEQDKMEILLELLFSEEEREVYRERYILNSKLLEKVPDDRNPFKEMQFSRVDFKKGKHSLQEFYDVLVKSRIRITDDITRETAQGVKEGRELVQTNEKMLREKCN